MMNIKLIIQMNKIYQINKYKIKSGMKYNKKSNNKS